MTVVRVSYGMKFMDVRAGTNTRLAVFIFDGVTTDKHKEINVRFISPCPLTPCKEYTYSKPIAKYKYTSDHNWILEILCFRI